MSWGLDGFLDIFLKGGDFSSIVNESLLLLLFGAVLLIVSMLVLDRRLSRGF
jgi:ABC-2 type transport system permease protein